MQQLTSKELILREDVCWLSLALCVLKPYAPEYALEVIAPEFFKGQKKPFHLTYKKVIELRESGYTFTQIGEMFNCNRSTASNIIRRHNKRKKSLKPDQTIPR